MINWIYILYSLNEIIIINYLLLTWIYLIYDKLRKRKIRIKKQDCKDLKFQLNFDNKTINFFYSINSKIRIHKINSTNFLSFKGDPLKKMIFYVLYKLKSYSKNKNRSIFALKMCNLLKKHY